MPPVTDIPSRPRAVLRPIQPADRRARLASLRLQLAQLERHEGHSAAGLSLGAPEIHVHLPASGLAGGVLHEMAGATYGDRPAAFGFVVALMAMAVAGRQRSGPAFLVGTRRAPFGLPCGRGLAQAGLDPSRLVLVET